jgi:hypothetical protein
MLFGSVHSLGPHSLDVTCKACGHHMTVNVVGWLDEVSMISTGPRILCRKCGRLGASVR